MSNAHRRNLLVIAGLLAFATSLFIVTEAHADYLPDGEDARQSVDDHERVSAYLDSDDFILSRLELRERSSDVLAHLIVLAHSSKTKRRVRARAIQCIALYRDDPRALTASEKLLTRIGATHDLFPAALMAYAHVAGEDSVPIVESYLSHADVDVRMAAVVALGRFGGQSGYERLAAHRQDETSAKVRKVAARYVD